MTDSLILANHIPEKNCLDKKIIIVTGAGAGIGKALSLSCANLGATVVLVGRTQQKLEAVYDEIEAAGLPQAAIYPINFYGACEQDYIKMREVLEEEFGRIDGLVNNASELGSRTPIENYSYTTWQEVMQVNINAPFMLTKTLLPLLKKSDNASIIFTSSGVATKGRAFWGAYAASKAAIQNLTSTLAEECDTSTKVRVNCINPGATQTDMRAAAYPAEDPKTLASPDAITNRYIYLLSDKSINCNGHFFDAQPNT